MMFSRQDEHEQREHEGEEPHSLVAGGTSYRVGDEFVGQSRRSTACGPAQGCGGVPPIRNAVMTDHRGHHVSGRIGESDLGVRRF